MNLPKQAAFSLECTFRTLKRNVSIFANEIALSLDMNSPFASYIKTHYDIAGKKTAM